MTPHICVNVDHSHTYRFYNSGFSDLGDFFDAAFAELEPLLKQRLELGGPAFVTSCLHCTISIDQSRTATIRLGIEGQFVVEHQTHKLHELYREFAEGLQEELDDITGLDLILVKKLVVHVGTEEEYSEYFGPRILV